MYPQPFGKYILERELARGGMARVLLATLRGAGGFEKRLVVKQIRDEWAHDVEFVRRFVDEAKTTVALSHPNIVPVYELGVEQGVYFIAMELVRGVSLAELLDADRVAAGERVGLSADEGAYLGVELCRALDYAHRRMNVVHRDLTPRNVMIDEEGQVRLIDFGIAAPARVPGHEVLGSNGHMPPEQLAGGALGPATDVFALAVLLMEAWSGEALFRRATAEACEAAMHAPHPRPSDAHPELAPLDTLIAECLQLEARDRPQEVDELGRALRAFLKERETEELTRRLGERVRAARAENPDGEPDAPGAERDAPSRGSSDAPSTRRLDDHDAPTITRTFAARGDAHEDDAPEAPSTRRLNSTPPEAPIPSSAPPAGTPASPSKVVAGRSPLAWGVGAFALVALAGAAWLLQRPAAAPAASLPAAPTLAAPAASLPAAPTLAAPAASSASAAAPPDSAPAAPAVPAALSATAPALSASASAPSASPARTVELVLLGELGTRVAVDGAPRGRTPARLSVEVGPHDVRFTFEPTGESQGIRVSARAGERVTLRSEFTGVAPTVRVVR